AVGRRRQPAGTLERIHLAVQHRAALLHAPVVSPPENPPAMHQRRADRNAALAEPERRLFDRCQQELVAHASTVIHGTALAKVAGGGPGVMLHMAVVFLVIGLIAALLGFTTIAGAAFGIAKFLAGLFLVLFLVFLIIGLAATRRIVG